MKVLNGFIAIALVLAGATTTARAEPARAPSVGFVELAGNFGFAFGEQEFVPTGSPGERENPLTNGFGFNATAGVAVIPGLDVIADYNYATATSRTGEVTGVLDGVKGSIDYHTLTAGVRTSLGLGGGRVYGELALGIVLPFDTRLEYEYAAPMSAVGIEGTGTRIENYNLGYGAHGEAGYQFPITSAAYLSTALRVQSFQSSNAGRTTEYENFVADFGSPQAITMDVGHATDSGEAPVTYSVQDLR
ncbi:MAG TPA: hypothetical protein VFU21_06395, partial [Kofleriaceae bacterium]|nr:hypothetical protein [Kofleriaceae bacterium]